MGEDIKKILGANIKEARIKLNLTQAKLAEKCDIQSTSFITELEQGKKFVTDKTLMKLAKILKLKYFQLFFTDDDKKEYDRLTLLNKLEKALEENVSKTIKNTIKDFS